MRRGERAFYYQNEEETFGQIFVSNLYLLYFRTRRQGEMSSFNAAAFSERLRRVDSTQASITTLSRYWLLTAGPMGSVVRSQASTFDSVALRASRDQVLALVFLASDVLHGARRTSSSLHASLSTALLRPLLRTFACAASRAGSDPIATTQLGKFSRLISIWRERGIFSAKDTVTLQTALDAPAGVIADQDDAEDLLRLLSGQVGTASVSRADGDAVGADVDLGDGQLSARPVSPLSQLESLVSAGDGASGSDSGTALRATAEGRLVDDTFAAAEAALASVERAELATQLSSEDTAAVASFCARVFILEDRAEEEAHANNEAVSARIEILLSASDPAANALEMTAAAVSRHIDAIRNEKRARESAVAALSSLLAKEEEACADDEGIARATEATLESIRSVRRRYTARMVDIAAASRAAAKAAEPEEGEAADGNVNSARIAASLAAAAAAARGGLLGARPVMGANVALPPLPGPPSLVTQTSLSMTLAAIGGSRGDDFGAIFTPGPPPPPPYSLSNQVVGVNGNPVLRTGGPMSMFPPRTTLPVGLSSDATRGFQHAAPPSYGSAAPATSMPFAFPGGAPMMSAGYAGAPPLVQNGAGRGVLKTRPAWMGGS